MEVIFTAEEAIKALREKYKLDETVLVTIQKLVLGNIKEESELPVRASQNEWPELARKMAKLELTNIMALSLLIHNKHRSNYRTLGQELAYYLGEDAHKLAMNIKGMAKEETMMDLVIGINKLLDRKPTFNWTTTAITKTSFWVAVHKAVKKETTNLQPPAAF